MLSLPIINTKPKKSEARKLINYEARRAGPLCILGPGKGVFGQPLLMSHISSNIYSPSTIDDNYYHFVTWNDDGMGEYCLWRYKIKENSPTFHYSPRTLVPREKSYLEVWREKVTVIKDKDQGQDVAKNFILDIQFPPSPSIGKLFFVTKRENYSKKGDNGVGLQMIKMIAENAENMDSHWYQVTEMTEPKLILTAKWTNTLLLGSISAAAVLVKVKGLRSFLRNFRGKGCLNWWMVNLDLHFKHFMMCLLMKHPTLYNWVVTIGSHNSQNTQLIRARFWITNSGALRVIVVTPQTPSVHPEWNELFTRSDILTMRMLGRRIGYFINEIEKGKKKFNYFKNKLFLFVYLFFYLDSNIAENLPKKAGKKAVLSGESHGEGTMDRFSGLHLYRCVSCKRILLKPLQCSRCKTVVYCSKVKKKKRELK